MRSSTPTAHVPQTLVEADMDVIEIGRLKAELDQNSLQLVEGISKLQEEAAAYRESREARIEELSVGVKSFAESHRSELTEHGKTKTVPLPSGGELQWRMTPPELVVSSAVKLATIIAALKRRGLVRFIRVKEELDKQALKKEPDVVSTVRGLSLKQHEEFIIKT